MDGITFKGLYLLKDNNHLARIRLENDFAGQLMLNFEKYYLDTQQGAKILKTYSDFCKDDLDNLPRKNFYKKTSEVPFFGEIKTNIINGNAEVISSIKKFQGLNETAVSGWVIHISGFVGVEEKHIFLFQSFNKAHMFLGQNKLQKSYYLGLVSGGIFSNITPKAISLNKNVDVVYLGGDNIYINDRDKFNQIFNYLETMRLKAPEVFRVNYKENNQLFSCSDEEYIQIVEAFEGNTRIIRKLFIVDENQVLNMVTLEKVKKHCEDEGVILELDLEGKIVIMKHNLETILDVLNRNYFTSTLTGEPFIVRRKKKR